MTNFVKMIFFAKNIGGPRNLDFGEAAKGDEIFEKIFKITPPPHVVDDAMTGP